MVTLQESIERVILKNKKPLKLSNGIVKFVFGNIKLRSDIVKRALERNDFQDLYLAYSVPDKRAHYSNSPIKVTAKELLHVLEMEMRNNNKNIHFQISSHLYVRDFNSKYYYSECCDLDSTFLTENHKLNFENLPLFYKIDILIAQPERPPKDFIKYDYSLYIQKK